MGDQRRLGNRPAPTDPFRFAKNSLESCSFGPDEKQGFDAGFEGHGQAGVDSEIIDDKVVRASMDGAHHDFEFPLEVEEFEVISVPNPRAGEDSALILLVKCRDNDSETDKWYFQFRGHFGSSTAAVEFGVAPPSNSKTAEILHLYGATFGFRLLFQPDGGAEVNWYYVTSCPTRSGKNQIGAVLHPKAQKMMGKASE